MKTLKKILENLPNTLNSIMYLSDIDEDVRLDLMDLQERINKLLDKLDRQ